MHMLSSVNIGVDYVLDRSTSQPRCWAVSTFYVVWVAFTPITLNYFISSVGQNLMQ